MSLSFLYIFNFVDYLSSFIKLFIVVVCFIVFFFFLKFSLSLLGCLSCWGLRVFGFWPSQLGFAVWNVIIIIIACVYFRKTLVFRPTVLDGSDWTDTALLLSRTRSIVALDVMELSSCVGPWVINFIFPCMSLLQVSVGTHDLMIFTR